MHIFEKKWVGIHTDTTLNHLPYRYPRKRWRIYPHSRPNGTSTTDRHDDTDEADGEDAGSLKVFFST